MKRLLGAAILILWFAAPAHAQYIGGSPNVGSGSGIGRVSFPSLPSAPPVHFEVRAVSGGADFVPSTFEPFEEAVAKGRVELAVEVKTLGEIARDNSKAAWPKAHVEFVQDHRGKAVIAQVASSDNPRN